MDVTKLSTKGQIVIPEKIREGFEPGVAFVVSKVKDLIVLKPVYGLSKNELKELDELNELWAEIEAGEFISHTSATDYLAELRKDARYKNKKISKTNKAS